MTHKEFTTYCNKNIPAVVTTDEDGGFRIYFESGEYVHIACNYDGLTYTHQGEEALRESNRKLISQLQLLTPSFYESIIAKYGS